MYSYRLSPFLSLSAGWQNDPRMEIHVTALLELLGIPFTGSGAHALAISYDKDMVLQLVKSIGAADPPRLSVLSCCD